MKNVSAHTPMRVLIISYGNLRWLILPFVCLLFLGCSTTGWLGWEGRLTKTDNRIPLEIGGPQTDVWQTRDIAIHYRFVREQDRLMIDGQVKRGKRIKYFHRLNAWIWIHFLDGDGYVLESRRLWAQNGSDVYWQIRYSFNRDWQIPPDTKAMGFHYSGRAKDRDVWWDFWRLP